MRKKWYVGFPRFKRSGVDLDIFSEHRPITRARYPEYTKVVGPFTTELQAREFVRSQRRHRTPLHRNPIELEGEEIYGDVLAIEARKGRNSLWPKENFRHDFTSKGAKIYGLRDGSLLIKGKKRLWKRFQY